jgi:adenine-specific DNA-methyltransferase
MHLQEAKRALGQPSYEDEHVLLYHGDCCSLMDCLPPETFHLVVTSPPYNIGKDYETKLSLEDYLDWTRGWIEKVYRLTRSTGAFWLNLGYLSIEGKAKAIPIPYLMWDRVPFFLMQEIVWNYGAGVAGRKFFSPRNEKFLWYVKNENEYTFNLDEVRDPNVKYPNQKKNGKLRCNTIGKNPSDVWQIAKVTSGENRSSIERMPHPAQFPLDLISRVVKASSNPDDLLLDPFVGSGSLLEAAIKTGRRAIGFEIRSDYVAVAATRLSHFRQDAQRRADQADLFPSLAAE